MIAVFTNKGKAIAYSAQIHTWLLKNRQGYRAERWSDIEKSKSDTENKWYVKIPPDYEGLNKGIAKAQDRLVLSKDAEHINKLPDNWHKKDK